MELDDIARRGAQEMLKDMLEAEVKDFIERNRGDVDEAGKRHVVRNGHLPEREVLTGAGSLKVAQPRARDRRGASHPDAVSFTSKILPPYLRRSKNVDELIPWLYLKGISTGDFQEALESLVGPEAGGLSATTVTRLTSAWVEEQREWSRRDLSNCEYVYLWADGVYFNIRLGDDDRQCILVLMGATKDGKKELVAVHDGYRESEQSWSEILLGLKQRGLAAAPKIAVGDGALGFWAALRKVFPNAREQRCWVHKTVNVLNKLPRSMQPKAKADIHEIWMSETAQAANKAFDHFVEKYEAKYPGAVNCLVKDRDNLLTFYDFPAEHWVHLRTTNPIESTFATVRLRQRRTKGAGSRSASLAMVFKLASVAEKKWRRLNGPQLVLRVVEGYRFEDGIMQERDAA
ncbi:MAG: IS256 family transposase [Planctomycetota bacterium]